MLSFVESLAIKGHLSVYKLYRDGLVEKVFDDKNVIVSGMGVGLSNLFTTSSSDDINNYRISKFQIGVSGWEGNQVSSTYELSGPLSSVEEYGVDSNLFLENAYQVKNGIVVSNNIFGLIPLSRITVVNNDALKYTIVLDEKACNNIASTRGNTALNEIGLFMKNPTRKTESDAPILVAYRAFSDIQKTSDFSLIFRWTMFGPEFESGELPEMVENPNPEDGASGVPVSSSFSWDDASGALSYAVYLGTSSTLDSEDFQGNQSNPAFTPFELEYNTTYYWRIDSVNLNGTTTGTVWSFTTEEDPNPPILPPDEVINPNPEDGASGVLISTTLSWDEASGATSYGVYLGTASAPDSSEFQGNQSGLSFTPSALLEYSTIYYWSIYSINSAGTTSGDIWSFTTESSPPPPGAPTSPSPASGAIDIGTEGIILSWASGASATSYAVYFGTTSAISHSEFQGNQAGLSFDPGTLEYSSIYYWKIGSINAYGTTSGTLWNFTTSAEPPPPIDPPDQVTNPDPPNNASGVAVSASLSWDVGFGSDSYDVFLGTTSSLGAGHYQGNFARGILSFTPSALLNYSTIYYWKINSINTAGTTSGVLWNFTTEAAPTAPTVTTQAITNITQNAAVGNGNVTDDGGATVTERGVVAAITPTPTTSNLKFAAPNGGEGQFTASMTGLSPETHYYVRAYAINSVGTSYGSQVEFDTLQEPDPPEEGEVVSEIRVKNAIASGVDGYYNLVRGTMPVASGVSSFNFYLRDSNGVAWPTDTIIFERGPSSVAYPSGVVEVVELRSKVQFSSNGEQTLTVEAGQFSSSETFHTNTVLQITASAPDTSSNPAQVLFLNRILNGGASTALAGQVTHTEQKFGELASSSGSKLFGYDAYVTTIAGISGIWLVDMMLYNANVGTPAAPLGGTVLPHLFFNEIQLQLPEPYTISHLLPTPYTDSTHLMKPNSNGKDHVLFMGAMKPYRFVVHTSTNVVQAQILLQHRGFFTCKHSKTLWSWSNPNTAFYGPGHYMVPELNLANYPGFAVTPTNLFGALANGTSVSEGFGTTTPLGPFHVRGGTDGGFSGGIGIEGFKGYELINEGDATTLKTYMAINQMDMDRGAGWKNNFGDPVHVGVALVMPDQKPVIAGQWDLSDMKFTNNPGRLNDDNPGPWGGRLTTSQWRYDYSLANSKIPDYYSTMNLYNEYKDSHVVRPMAPTIPLVWLFNDPLAKAILAHFSTWGRARMYEAGFGDLKEHWDSANGPQNFPGKGGGSGIAGRIGGWAILNHCADFLVGDEHKRASYASWFTLLKQHHAASQLPSGSWQAFTQYSLPACEPNPISNPPCGFGGGDHPNGDLYAQWYVNGNPWDVDPDECASQSIEISIHGHGMRAFFNCTGDSEIMDMLASGCTGLYNFHWRKESGVPLGGAHFVTPVRKRSNVALAAHTDLSAASDCATDNTDNYQVGALIMAGLVYDQNHEGAWRCMHAMTGTNFGAGPGLGDVQGLINSLTNSCTITGFANVGNNKMSEGWGAVLAFVTDYLLNQ